MISGFSTPYTKISMTSKIPSVQVPVPAAQIPSVPPVVLPVPRIPVPSLQSRYSRYSCTMTFTMGDSGENHVGMATVGTRAQAGQGFTLQDMQRIQSQCASLSGVRCQIHHLNSLYAAGSGGSGLPAGAPPPEDAYLAVISGFLDTKAADDIFTEQNALSWDSKYWDSRRKKVLNKHARRNLIYDVQASSADYANKQGTVIGWNSVPKLAGAHTTISNLVGPKASNLICEGNLYYDPTKTGIGWHGDTERVKVIGLRIGATLPLCYRWWYKSKSFGKTLTLSLNHGDIYIMSEKAVGNDWKKRNTVTLRHSAGSAKYTDVNK